LNYLASIICFLKVTQNKSTKAAVELHLTQPAVSILLKFSGSIQFPLTRRLNRKLYVTDFGKETIAASVE
jgi:DNA-binding transcriptional LysR family regulator